MDQLQRKRTRRLTLFISVVLIFIVSVSSVFLAADCSFAAEPELTLETEMEDETLLTEEIIDETTLAGENDLQPEDISETEEAVTGASDEVQPADVQGESGEPAVTPESAPTAQDGDAADAYYQSVPVEEDALEDVLSLQEDLSLNAASGTLSVKTGYVNVDGLNVRSGAGTGYSAIGTISYSRVVILGSKKDSNKKVWYKINYGSKVGYIHGNYVTDIKTVTVDKSAVSQFPASYQNLLAGILAVYPNFKFVPEDIPFTLAEAANWHYGKKVQADGNGWWETSSYATVLEYMDPLMYFTTDKIFAFAEQYYNKSQTKAGLKKMLTALDCFLNTDDYIAALLEAGKKYDVNPYVLAATITIEKGSHADTNGNQDVTGRPVFSATVSKNGVTVRSGAGTGYSSRGTVDKGTIYLVGASKSKASYKTVSGKKWYQVIYNGYPGYIVETYLKNIKYYDSFYNLFSINQSDDNVVVGGISYAMDKGWNTPYKSLVGGAAFYRNGYINNGQDTYYYKDFNVANDQSNWWHEYAGAINSPEASALLLSYAYTNDASASLTFRIPVYKGSGNVRLSAPKLNAVTNRITGSRISWKAVKGATKYRVYKKVSGKWKTLGYTTGTAYIDTSVKAGETNTYTVASCMGSVLGYYDETGKTCTFLKVPTGIQLKEKTAGIRISWNKQAQAKKYRVYRKLKGGKWTCIATTTKTAYTDKTFSGGRTYIYTVRSVASDGSTSWYKDTPSILTKLSAPKLKSAVSVKNGVKVRWKAVTGATVYYVYKKTASGWKRIGKSTGKSFVDKTAKSGKTYTYTVAAVKNGKVGRKNTAGVKIKYKKP